MPLTGHVRFGGGLRGKGPEFQAPRRVAYPALDCLNPNLQKMQLSRPPERRLKPAPCPASATYVNWCNSGVWSDAQRGYLRR
jgi:hypothetical protein